MTRTSRATSFLLLLSVLMLWRETNGFPCPSVHLIFCVSPGEFYVNDKLVDFTARLHQNRSKSGFSQQKCGPYKIEERSTCLKDYSTPFVHLASIRGPSKVLSPPVVSLLLNNKLVEVSLTDSRNSATHLFAALVKKLHWSSLAIITDRHVQDINEAAALSLDGTLPINSVIPAGSDFTENSRWNKMTNAISSNHDAVLVTCSSIHCYDFTVKFLHRLSASKNFSIVLNEYMTRKMRLDMASDWPFNFQVKVLGIRKVHDSQTLRKQLASQVNEMIGCSDLSNMSCLLSMETELEKALNLYDAIQLVSVYQQKRQTSLNKDAKFPLSSVSTLTVKGESAEKLHMLYDILEFQPRSSVSFETVGSFHDNSVTFLSEDEALPAVPKARSERAAPAVCPEAELDPQTSQRHFRITTVEEPPFLMVDENNTYSRGEHHGNLTGFIVEMTNELANRLGFNYSMTLVSDGKYGNVKVDGDDTLSAQGMIGEVLRCEKDLSISAMAITASRSTYVAFTKPWMDYGLLLYRTKPLPEEPLLLAFLNPFEATLWVVILGCLVAVAFVMVILHFISPDATPENPRQREDYSRNVFTSTWLLYVTAVQQEPDYIAFLSGKILLGGWFFFCLIIVSTYTANLAAFLTVERIPQGITSVDDLALQTEVTYGTVIDTAVEEFFLQSKISTYEQMGFFMSSTPTAMVQTSADAVRKVRSEDYVFIWDSPILEYFASQAPCNTEVFGRTFNTKGYGIAMPQGMSYLESFTLAILAMREDGMMNKLSDKWLDSSQCSSVSSTTDDAGKVGIRHMLGVVLFLGVSCCVALLTAVLERVVRKKKRQRTVSALQSNGNIAGGMTTSSETWEETT